MSLKKIKKALTMVLTASVALSAAGCGKDVAKNNMTEEKTVETTVQESSSETISDDTKRQRQHSMRWREAKRRVQKKVKVFRISQKHMKICRNMQLLNLKQKGI